LLDIKEEVINFGGTEKLSRLEMGEILCEEAGLDKSGIVKTSVYDMKDVPLCPDVSMNTGKLKSLGIEPKNFRESLTDMLKTRGV
jgi:nucleoside-diphosphate-sugar epimerase